jgi:ADP-heptose:LPS heptosyltransferase
LRVETIPAAPSYLTADPAEVERWRKHWRDLPRPLVGVAWQGNPKHVGDRWRSLKLAQLAPVAAAVAEQRGTLVAVQVGPGTEQLADAPFPVTDFRAGMPPAADFADTAAALCALDRVVTVDSAVAHLAGALGRPVAVLLPLNADWRWLRDRPDTPWYPSATLFRQQAFADWQPAIDAAAGWAQGD